MSVTIRKRVYKGIEQIKHLVIYRDAAGTRRQKEFDSPKEAALFDRNPLRQLNAGKVQLRERQKPVIRAGKDRAPAPVSINPTVEEAKEWWIRSLEEGRDGRPPAEPYTIKTYDGYYRNHLKERIGDKHVRDYTHVDALALRDELNKTISRAMARKVVTAAKSIFGAARAKGIITTNPFADVKVYSDKRQNRKRFSPSREDMRKILEIMHAEIAGKGGRDRWVAIRYYTMIMVDALTGLRSSELRGLRWPHLYLEAKMIDLQERAGHGGVLGNLKSAAAYRPVQLDDQVIAVLEAWRPMCPETELDLVFPTYTGGIEGATNLLRRGFQRPQKRAGVKSPAGRPYTLHEIRHFFASLRQAGGYSMKELQVEIGHASITMTADVYGHLFKEDDAERRQKAQEIADKVFADPKMIAAEKQAAGVAKQRRSVAKGTKRMKLGRL